LGAPLSTDEAARVIGCSVWTVRQKLVPRGLPYFRCGGGRLIFYKNQIIRWVEAQQKGML
jgi:excisionase family DNA binding protein